MGIIEKLDITPGPWYEANSSGHQGLVISENTGDNIAVTYEKKNAKVIGASLEMLKALIEVMFDIEDYEISDETTILPIIEKATGKTWQEIKELLWE